MASKKPFYTEGMTIEEIMSLGDDTIRNLKARDISRAVRTLSLAANKRFNRMLNRADVKTNKKGKVTKITERADKRGNVKGLDFNALYGYSSYIEAAGKGKKVKPFGVTNVKVPKEDEGYTGALKAEFTRVRNFLRAQSTTIEGAVELRKQKEVELFGVTREEWLDIMYEAGYSKDDLWRMVKERDQLMSDVYDTFHKWKEIYATLGTYDTKEGKKMLKEIGISMNKGISDEDTLATMTSKYTALAKDQAAAEEDIEEERRRRLRGQ